MLGEGARLMVVGMVTVFAFLGLLVGLMKASAAFFEAYADRFPDPQPASARKDRPGHEDEIALIIAIAEAVRRGQKV